MNALAGLAERVSRGDEVGDAEAELILQSHDLITIGVMADAARRRLRGTETTFLRVVEVHVGAPPSSLPHGASAGEIRIVGRPSSIDEAIGAVRITCTVAGSVPVAGFSLADLVARAADERVPVAAVFGRLREAGLYAISEVPVDILDEGAEFIDAARAAGLVVNRLTVDTLLPEARIATVGRARDLQRTCGGFRVFAPLPRTMALEAPTTGYDDVKQIAIARVVALEIPSIQVDWALYGPKLAQVALTMGADDVDAVAALDSGVLGTRRSALEEIRGNIRAAGLQPVERNGRFEVLG